MGAVLLSAAVSASAQTADPEKGAIHQWGAGSRSCGNWLADRGNTFLHNVELSWVLGWSSASSAIYGVSLGGHMRQTDSDAVAAWLDKYCRENPLKSLTDASLALNLELLKPE
jgi:hypothetical protein